MYLPHELQSAEYAAHVDEIEAKCERRREIEQAKESRNTVVVPLGPRLRVELYRRAGPALKGREVGTRESTS